MLLILAGITISTLFNKNGIISKALDAKNEWEVASLNEQESLDEFANEIDKLLEEYNISEENSSNDNTSYDFSEWDTSKPMSVTINLTNPITNGGASNTIRCYYIAGLCIEGNDFQFVFENEYDKSGVDLSELPECEPSYIESIKSSLLQYTMDDDIPGGVYVMNESGSAEFNNLALGLYLFVLEDSQESFLFTSPYFIGDAIQSTGNFSGGISISEEDSEEGYSYTVNINNIILEDEPGY